MAPRRSNQEWKTLLQQCEESSLTIKEFCRQNNLATSAFYTKRQQLNVVDERRDNGFVHAQITERTMQYQVPQPPVANMALSIGDIELSIPQGTSAIYLAELIEALQS
ncbi:IS66 family insertion sequence element accessory protein TnpA [Vibrio splendidus]|uniref:IS66 family insertion sequence element accessory protein TnpA n=1 Tax=Vibrio splendidus TaxID=29497 RepID=UPI003D0C89F1